MRKESDAENFNCIICKEDSQYYSVGICDHKKVCLFCCLKSRILYKDKKCPICTTKLEQVYIFENHEKPSLLEIEKNKEYYYKDDDFEENGIYFASFSSKEETLNLKSFICPIKSCHEGAFENLQILCTHVNKVHKRYYCETCLKEGKRFLSEMPIYTYESLNEHITYGEYSEKGTLIVPPHPICGFCNIKFYNDEHLFKHMNEHHFICQMCRDKKNIIFYKEITQLLDHYKFLHYVCPYQECLEDMFVVFDTEEKLNSHLLTKHKCVDAQNKITGFHLQDTRQNSNKPNKTYSHKDEFNFSNYVNEMKERVKAYSYNIVNNSRYVKPDENFYSQQGQNEYNNYDNRNLRGGKNEYSQDYNYNQNQYDQNYSQGQTRSRRGGKKKKGNDEYYANESVQSYGGETYNQYDQIIQNNNNFTNQNEYYNQNSYYGGQSNARGKGKSGGNGRNNKQNINNFNNNGNYNEQPSYNQNYEPKGNIKPQSFKTPLQTKPTPLQNFPITKDYSFIFNSFLKLIKDYINHLIKRKEPKEEDFVLHKETIYQLIIIIDKLSNDKLLELTSLTNFGVDLDIYRELRNLMAEANFDQYKISHLLDQLDLRIVLIIYKYFSIACKKIDGIFYKLDFDQIDPDLYDDFVTTREKKFTKLQLNTVKAPVRRAEYIPMPSSKKYKMNEQNFPSLIGMSNNKNEVTKKDGNKLKSILEPPKKKEEVKTEDNKINLDSSKFYAKPSSKGNKLTVLFDEKLNIKTEVKKETNWKNKKFKKSNVNYEYDFPEL